MLDVRSPPGMNGISACQTNVEKTQDRSGDEAAVDRPAVGGQPAMQSLALRL